MSQADERAERGEHPDHGRGGYSNHRAVARQNNAATHKADTGYHLSQHPGWIDPVSAERGAERNEKLGPETDQNAGADARCFTSQLSFQPDDATAENRGAEPKPERRHGGVERIIGHGGHYPRVRNAAYAARVPGPDRTPARPPTGARHRPTRPAIGREPAAGRPGACLLSSSTT